ncbi:MAG TPA: hypothetical protein IGS31_20665, partial [Oscillatoriales cyanobacterium M4454_W2019_049]|nr:hypothetical protein [Oscillatoriales cyanobacterium M4454_W2019_049]
SIGKLWTWREFNPPPRTEDVGSDAEEVGCVAASANCGRGENSTRRHAPKRSGSSVKSYHKVHRTYAADFWGTESRSL